MDYMQIAEFEKRIRELDLTALHDFKSGRADAPILLKCAGYLKSAEPSQPMAFVCSEESEDRMGDIVSIDGWELKTFQSNPVFMFSHDYTIAPIGTVPKVWKEGKQLLNTVSWDEADELARFLKGKYERKIMRAESVGFRVLDFEELPQGQSNGPFGPAVKFLKQELLEISAVAVPAHPHALMKAMASKKFSIIVPDTAAIEKVTPQIIALQKLFKGIITWEQAHSEGTPAADKADDWDAAAEVAAASVDALKIMCAWVDSDNAENKAAYKLPHHKASGAHAVVFRAVGAAIAVLNGGRGGADIPDADRQGVYNHLAKHMRDDFSQEPAELKSMKNIVAEKASPDEMQDIMDALEASMAMLGDAHDMMSEMMGGMEGGEGESEQEGEKGFNPNEIGKIRDALKAFRE